MIARATASVAAAVLLLLPSTARVADDPGAAADLMPVARAGLCVTEGELVSARGSGLSVATPRMRAYVNQPVAHPVAAESAQIHFIYLGPTAQRVELASGEQRVQFGLKLRAADACNLLYVMWRVEPQPGLVVSVKTNPNAHASAVCGNEGYETLKPQSSAPLPRLRVGGSHTLRATLRLDQLRVWVDERPVWQGDASAASALQGPAGVRSDNVRLDFELAVEADATKHLPGAACRHGAPEP
jgi:hypothetical protein